MFCLQVWDAVWQSSRSGGKVHVFKNKGYNSNLQAGSKLKFSFLGQMDGSTAPTGKSTEHFTLLQNILTDMV